jgi:heat shock protein HslJ
MSTLRTILPGMLALVLLSACAVPSPGPTGSGSAEPRPPLDGTSWTLVEVPGLGTPVAPAPTMIFRGDSAHGSDGCDRYRLPYAAEGASLSFVGHGMRTRSECPLERARQADAFRTALEVTRTYRVRDGSLRLLSADGSTRAVLAPRTVSLAGTRWKAIALGTDAGAIAGVVPGTAPTLQFGQAGQASGSAGCNRFTGTWSSQGIGASVRPGATTRMACGEASMAQERAYLQALQAVEWFLLDGDRLELRRASGALAVALQREPD